MIRSEISVLWRHGRVYALANVASRAGGFLLLPLYAKLLSPVEFGAYALIVVLADLAAGLLAQGLGRAMMPVYLGSGDDAARRRVVSTVLIASTAAAVAIAVLAPLGGEAASALMIGDPARAREAALGLACIPAIALFQVQLFVCRVQKRSGRYLAASVAKAVLLVVLNLLFVLSLGMGVAGIFLGTLIAFSTLAAVLLVDMLRREGIGFSASVLGQVLRIGGPLMPASLLDLGATVAERFLINVLLSTAHVGVYMLATRISQFLQMFVAAPFYQIWVVRRLEAAGSGAAADASVQVFRHFVTLLTCAALLIATLSPEIVLALATPDYLSAAPCIAFLALGAVLSSIRLEAEVAILGTRRTAALPAVSACSLAGGIAATAALVWTFGLAGAAAGSAIRQFLHLLLMQVAAARLAPGRPTLPFGNMTALVALAVATYLTGLAAFGSEVEPASTAGRFALCAAFTLAVSARPLAGPVLRAVRARRSARPRALHTP